MTTQYLTASKADVEIAGRLLASGKTVAIPTETVYGLAANALSAQAVAQIFVAKGRPQDNPLIVHIQDIDTLYTLCAEVPKAALDLAQAFWPGPLTMILPKSDAVPDAVSGGLPTVAVRFPAHPTALAVIKAAGVPLAAPSANRSGSPSPTTAARVAADLDGRVDAIVNDDDCAVGVESTVITLCTEVPRVLRPGAVTPDQLRAILGNVDVDDTAVSPLKEGQTAASPGMKYQHYAPAAKAILVNGDAASTVAYINERAGEGVLAMVFDGEEEGLAVPFLTYGARNDDAAQARQVFEALRMADDRGAHTVYIACPRAEGVGLAVYNRLLRAAAFRVVTL